MNRTVSLESAEYTPVAQEDPQQGQNDPPPAYEPPPQVFTQGVTQGILQNIQNDYLSTKQTMTVYLL